MTLLSIVQSAAVRLVGRKPSVVTSSTRQFDQEMVELANEGAQEIASRHDWRALTVLSSSIVGNGVATAFSLPADYDRMPVKGRLNNGGLNGLRPARDLDEWLGWQTYPVIGSPGAWIMLDGKIQINPAPPTGQVTSYYYISNKVVADSGGTTKTEFTNDSDTFRLPERLLRLYLIWRYKSDKELDYTEAQRDYEIALAQEIARERGPRTIVVGSVRVPRDAMGY